MGYCLNTPAIRIEIRFLIPLRYVRNDSGWSYARVSESESIVRSCVDSRVYGNHDGLAKATYGNENALVPGTGNHKGCPYDGFA